MTLCKKVLEVFHNNYMCYALSQDEPIIISNKDKSFNFILSKVDINERKYYITFNLRTLTFILVIVIYNI